MKKPIFDLHSLSEDQRIEIMGKRATEGNVVGCLIDDDEEKIKRYVDKVTERFPLVKLMERVQGPTKGVVTLKFGPKLN